MIVDEDRDDEDCNEERWEVEVIYATGQGRAEQSRDNPTITNINGNGDGNLRSYSINQSMTTSNVLLDRYVSSHLISSGLASRQSGNRAIPVGLSVCMIFLVCISLLSLILNLLLLLFFHSLLRSVPFRLPTSAW